MKINEAYILSYIKGSLSDLEKKECDMLMASSSDFSKKVAQITKAQNLFDNLEAQKKINTESAWKKLHRKIKNDNAKKTIWNITRNAAAILLPLFLLLQYVAHPLLKQTPNNETITLYSAPGVVTKVLLPDGSEVWLNSQSKLTYPLQFTKRERAVELIGEAYFKVVSDEKNRFNVITSDNTVVSAYGTEYNVNAYNENNQHIVTLAKGNAAISLSKQKKEQAIIPGQKAVINTVSQSLSIDVADTYVETAWKDGKMVFRREDIKKIATRLSRKFGVTIEVKGNVEENNRFTATFTNESLEDILELLKFSSLIDYSISKQKKLSDETFSQKVVTIVCK